MFFPFSVNLYTTAALPGHLDGELGHIKVKGANTSIPAGKLGCLFFCFLMPDVHGCRWPTFRMPP